MDEFYKSIPSDHPDKSSVRKVLKKLREIGSLENQRYLNPSQQEKVATKQALLDYLESIKRVHESNFSNKNPPQPMGE